MNQVRPEITAEAATLLGRIAAIPMEFRNFSVPRRQAARLYGLDVALLDAMDRAGLSRPFGADLHYDGYDCANLSLHLKLPSVQRMAMRSWAATLRIAQGAPTLDYRLDIALEPGMTDNSRPPLDVMVPEGGRRSLMPDCNGVLLSVKGANPCRYPPFSAEVTALLDEVEAIDFFMLSERMRWNVEVIVANRFAECGGCAKWLKTEAGRRGLPARQFFGLLLAKPYSTPHFWTAFQVGNQWVPVDPLLIKLLRQTANLLSADWPLHRSPGAAFLPLAEVLEFRKDDGRPVIQHVDPALDVVNPLALLGGREVPVSLPTVVGAGGVP